MSDPIVEIWSLWRHKNGIIYRVTGLANMQTERPKQYPQTVIYENVETGAVWCRRLDDWRRSMTKEPESE